MQSSLISTFPAHSNLRLMSHMRAPGGASRVKVTTSTLSWTLCTLIKHIFQEKQYKMAHSRVLGSIFRSVNLHQSTPRARPDMECIINLFIIFQLYGQLFSRAHYVESQLERHKVLIRKCRIHSVLKSAQCLSCDYSWLWRPVSRECLWSQSGDKSGSGHPTRTQRTETRGAHTTALPAPPAPVASAAATGAGKQLPCFSDEQNVKRPRKHKMLLIPQLFCGWFFHHHLFCT